MRAGNEDAQVTSPSGSPRNVPPTLSPSRTGSAAHPLEHKYKSENNQHCKLGFAPTGASVSLMDKCVGFRIRQ